MKHFDVIIIGNSGSGLALALQLKEDDPTMSIAVVEGTRDEAIPDPGLDLSSLTMQKLFIHLTENQDQAEGK